MENNNIDKTINENMPFLFKNPPLQSVPSIDCCLNGDYKILPGMYLPWLTRDM